MIYVRSFIVISQWVAIKKKWNFLAIHVGLSFWNGFQNYEPINISDSGSKLEIQSIDHIYFSFHIVKTKLRKFIHSD